MMIIPTIRKDRKGNIPAIGCINLVSSIKNKDYTDTLYNKSNIKQIVCGEDHSIIIDADNNAYSFGNNDKGQLGLGHCWNVDKPTLIEDLKGKVKLVKSTYDLSVAVTTNNEVYIWPYDSPFSKYRYKPLRLYLDSKIIILNVSCGKNYVMLLSTAGILYAFGKSNKSGELGTGDQIPRLSPEPLYSLCDKGEKITQISCGFKHCLAKNHNGKVFSWGLVNYFIILRIWTDSLEMEIT